MNFIKNYRISDKRVNSLKSVSKEFVERNTPFIYAVTATDTSILITKLDASGVVIWSKQWVTDFQPSLLHDCFVSYDFNKYAFVVSETDYNTEVHNVYVVKFDSSGISLEVRKLDLGYDQAVAIRVQYYKSNFYLATYSNRHADIPNLIKVDIDTFNFNRWEMINQPYGNDSHLSFYIDPDTGNMLFSYILWEDNLAYTVLRDQDLKIIEELQFSLTPGQSEDPLLHINEAIVKTTGGANYYAIQMSSHLRPGNRSDLCFVKTVESEIVDKKIVNFSGSSLSGFALVDTSFYLTETFGTAIRVTAFDCTSWDQLWKKEINVGQNIRRSRLCYNETTGNVTSIVSNNNFEGGVENVFGLVYHDKDLNSSCVNDLANTLPKGAVLNIVVSREYTQKVSEKPIPVATVGNEWLTLNPTTSVVCTPSGGGGDIPIKDITSLQSPNFFLQSTGSLGADSTKGIHLRWIFGGALGEKHLPKRDYAQNTHNFNKPNDVVSVYRTPYVKYQFLLNLYESPSEVNDANRTWVYQTGSREIHVYFRNVSKYSQVRATINPQLNAAGFIQSYGDEVIEIENKQELFFAAEISAENFSSGSTLQTETLSVQGNMDVAVKTVSSRKTYNASELNNVRLVSENGRSIRFKTNNCDVSEIRFEFYGDFIADANKQEAWTFMGDYALTTQDNEAFALLEPAPGAVNKHWQRFNDNAYVRVENYQKKWNRETEDWDRNIQEIVQSYINLSNDAGNPTGIDTITYGADPDEGIEPTTVEISTLDQLNFAAYDYHIARMLGLGFLDVDSTVFTGEYVYVAEYTTFGDLEDGLGAREVHHLAMGLPTALSNERLPLPVNLDRIEEGAFTGNEGAPQNLTDDEGYTQGGTSRFVTLYAESQPEDQIGSSFYQFTNEFSLAESTNPVYAGIEYQQSSEAIQDESTHVWKKPELPNDLEYQNEVPVGETAHNETRFLQVPENDLPFYVHRQDRSGWHHYSSYGINWFSRATSGTEVEKIETRLKPTNTLLPPANVNPLLIRRERPLFLTSNYDQDRLHEMNPTESPDVDETLVRITFDYNAAQDMIKRTVPLDSQYSNDQIEEDDNNPDILFPNDDEIFADVIDIFFRGELPNNISGKATLADVQPSSNILTAIQTEDYIVPSSNGEDVISPVIAPGTEDNYVGGVFVMGDQQHIIYSVEQGGVGPIITIYKKEISDAIVNNTPAEDADNLQDIDISEDGLFMAIENMQSPVSWGTPNPHPLTIAVGYDSVDDIKREVIQRIDEDGFIEREVEKSRGIWSKEDEGHTTIEKELEPIEQYDDNGVLILDAEGNPDTVDVHRGLYKIKFHGIEIAQHPQYWDLDEVLDSIEWYRGTARIFTEGSFDGAGIPNKTRKVLPVVRIENIPTDDNPNPGDLIIYVNDPTFPEVNEDDDTTNDVPYDYIQTGADVSVNFYPGYKAFLYKNDPYGLNRDTIQPDTGEGVRYSIFGMRSRNSEESEDYKSRVSVPSIMFAQEIVEPQAPKQPEGADYATRPDFFGRSTFTITTEYEHQPHGVLFYRTNDEALLNALYSKPTVASIREELKKLGGHDEDWLKERWQEFLQFGNTLAGDFTYFPPEDQEAEFRYKFPNPDKQALFDWANEIRESLGESTIDETPGTLSVREERLLPFVQGAIYSAFVPLTEVPIIYQHVEDNSYTPVNEKQVVRDENGYVLSPGDERFKMAPMMKRVSNNPHETQFVDFNLDGTSRNIYFYGVRELGSLMKMGPYSPFLGPIKLVNTNPPETPEVKRIMPVLENAALGIDPSIQLEINAYAEVENIKKITIYRALSMLDAQSVRTMQLVKTIDLDEEGIMGDTIWRVHDNFEGLDEIPYNEGLFYRLTVSRKVEYADKTGEVITEYQPSKPSKITATMMVEAGKPASPVLTFTSDEIPEYDVTEITNIVLNWEKTCYNGKYSIYKMNSQGNWVKIHEVTSNESNISLPLVDTDLASGTLPVRNADNIGIYHHFKALVENTSGNISTEENILTILQNLPDDGIGQMIIGDTFIVR